MFADLIGGGCAVGRRGDAAEPRRRRQRRGGGGLPREAVVAPEGLEVARRADLAAGIQGGPLERSIENPKLVRKRCKTSVFNEPF
jgi:hypothetical protein